MTPFDTYPGKGLEPIGRVPIGESRQQMAQNFQRITGQTTCACCGTDFSEDLNQWLTMTLESVVPLPVCRRADIPGEWADDAANRMLLCAACDQLGRSVQLGTSTEALATFEAFVEFRNAHFAERQKAIAARRRAELDFFNSRPWQSLRKAA